MQDYREQLVDLEVVAAAADGMAALDPSGRLIYANAAAAQILGFDDVETLLAMPVDEIAALFEIFDESGRPLTLEDTPGRRALRGEESRRVLGFRNRDTGEERWALVRATPVFDADGALRFAISLFYDLTDQKRAEYELATRARQQETIVKLGRLALAGESVSTLLETALDMVADTLNANSAGIFELVDENTLLLRTARGVDPQLIGTLKLDVDGRESLSGYTALIGEPVIVEDFASETRFKPHPLLQEMGARSGLSVVIEPDERGFGVLSALSFSVRHFPENDINFLQAVANILSEAIAREWAEHVRVELLALERGARDEAELVARRLGAIQKVTDVALSSLPLDDLLHELLVRIREILGVDAAAILLPSLDNDEELSVAASIGLPQDMDMRTPVPMGRGVVGQIAATAQPLVIDDLSTFEVVSPTLKDKGIVSVAGVPLVIEGRARGVVHVGSLIRRHFMPEEVALLQLVAERASTAIDRAHLLQAEREARREAERRHDQLSFIARAGEILSGSLDFRETLARIAQLAVPHIADWCLVELLEDDEIRTIEAIHSDTEKVALAWELRRRWPVRVDEPVGPPAVIRTGKSELYEEVPDEALQMAARDEEHLKILRSLGLKSAMVVPLTARGRTFGSLTFVIDESGRRYTADDVAFVEYLGRRAALAIDNANLFHDVRRSSERFSKLVQSVGAIFWEADPRTFRFRFVSQKAEELLGYPLDDWLAPDFWRRIAYEEDAERTLEAADAAIQRGDDEYGMEYRLVTADGRIVWVKDIVSVVRDPAGRPAFLRGVMVDITDQKNVERHLEDSRERYAHLARVLQRSLLPPELPRVPGFEVAARYRPSGEGNEVGGDFYDVFEIPSTTDYAVVIGDVCGKGPRAASLTGLARHTVRAAAGYEHNPSSVLQVLNDAINREVEDTQFATVSFARLHPEGDRASLAMAIGGHPLPFLLKSNGTVQVVGRPGMLLGVVAQPELTDFTLQIERGDALVFYTDGVAEERGPDIEPAWLPQLLRSLTGFDAEMIAEAIERAAVDYLPGEPRDDIALLVVRLAP